MARVIAALVSDGPTLGPAIWPGYRPDSIPMLVRFGEDGALLFGWLGTPPAGFEASAIPGALHRAGRDPSAANTSIELDYRAVAQFAAGSLDSAALRGLAAHEAFHAFQRTAARDGRRFGQGENAFLVTQYPVFDPDNDAGFFLELALLRDALLAPGREGAARFAREYVAARERRHRRLEARLAEFEQQAELNEGLAEYALVRARYADPADGAKRLAERLVELPSQIERSIRLRYYVTGAASAFLLDRLAGPEWKVALVRENRTLQDALAEATDFRSAEQELLARAGSRHRPEELAERAREGIDRLRSSRRAVTDSLLAQPGLRLVLAFGDRWTGLCGIDPQNLLPAGEGRFLHTRWVHLCSGDRIEGELTTGSVEDRQAGTWTAVIGPESAVTVRSAGERVRPGVEPVRLERVELSSPLATLRFAAARISRSSGELRIELP
ncbi:MAG: hypothetical protein R2909_08300 [Gemmatimonadales bacterium]